MSSLRDQLEKLRKQIGTTSFDDVGSNAISSKSLEHGPAKETDWKAGVTPLDNKLRKRQSSSAQPNGKLTLTQLTNGKQNKKVGLSSVVGKPKPRSKTSSRSSPAPLIASSRPPAKSHLAANRLFDLTEPVHFKLPEAWVDLGQAVQPPNGGTGRNLSVHVGIDFGSAYTKVAIRFADKVHPVSWQGISNAPSDLYLPGEISRMPDGTVLIGRAPSAAEVWSGIKQPFLRPDPTPEARAAAAAFLAAVLRYARAWLFKNYGSLLQGRKLAWNLAIGCPTNAIDNSDLVKTYVHLLSAGWLLSRSSTLVPGMDSATRALALAQADPDSLQLDSLGVVPEFVAQIAGYARSAQRKRGLHCLVDIGAGTLDVATFTVEKDKSDYRDHFSVLESSVELLGTHFLMDARHGAAEGALRWNDSGRVPDTDVIANEVPERSRELRDADYAFEDKVRGCVQRVIHLTKIRRSPLSPAWDEGLPIFRAGGGANCDVYRRAVQTACSNRSVQPIQLPLSVGDDFESFRLDPNECHRLSVAYGLTSDSSMLATITAKGAITNFILSRRGDQADRDQLYPK